MDLWKLLIVILVLVIVYLLIRGKRGGVEKNNIKILKHFGGDDETPEFPHDKDMLKNLVDKNEKNLKGIYHNSNIEKVEYNFFIDQDGTIRDVRKGEEQEVHLPAGEYIPTYLTAHTHPINEENVEGPSGADLFALTGHVHDGLSNGEMIICPESIWFVFPSEQRVKDFKYELEYKGYMEGEGQSLLKLFRHNILSMEQYLEQLYEIGLDVYVYEKKLI